ncbi:MAG: hypothetical protein M0P95_16905 [Sulfuritalea sp.]|jgi:hypothetical protein|nr:hypothetical protein [Sulfuritalea sp.]
MRSAPVAGVFAVVLLAGLLLTAYWAGGRGLADVVAKEPRYEMDRWRSGKLVPDAIKLKAIQAELYKARDLDPGNPNLLEDLGRFHAARTERGRADDMAVRETRQESLAWFRQSLELRPTSGHAYVNVALMKFRLGEIDQEFSGSLQQALHRSPWEPQVQLMAIELGLASWQALSESTRQAIHQAIRAQGQWRLVNQKPALLALFKRYKRPDLDCLLEVEPNACGAS